MRSELFSADNLEKESAQPGLRLQNSKMLNVELNGEVMARRAALVGQVDQPTCADPQAAVCWSASLQTGYHRHEQLGLGTLIGRTTGETCTMSFSGQGFGVIQPSEQPPGAIRGQGQNAGTGGLGS